MGCYWGRPRTTAAFWPEEKVAHNTTEKPEDRSLAYSRTIRPLKASERVALLSVKAA